MSKIVSQLLFLSLLTLVGPNDNQTTPTPLLVLPLIHHGSAYYKAYLLNSSLSDDIKSPITQGKHGFSTRLEIGSQNLQQFVYVDSGSSLLWVNCKPCKMDIPEPVYEPTKSLTYKRVPCINDTLCDTSMGAPQPTCQKTNVCTYMQRYADDNTNDGHIARESFYFGYNVFREIGFGCSKRTSLFANGVMGLGNKPISLLKQTNSTIFAHCIGNLSDTVYDHHTLVIGNNIRPFGKKVPMSMDGQYSIEMDSIWFGDELLEFNGISVFPTKLVLDSGSTLTFLPQTAVLALEDKLIEQIAMEQNETIFYKQHSRLCYNGLVTSPDLTFDFPIVEFSFGVWGDNNYLELQPSNLFQQVYDNVMCLSIVPQEVQGLPFSLLGNLMMQYHYMAYDIGQGYFYFDAIGCENIYDYIN